MRTIHPRAVGVLEEAVREIQHMAGLVSPQLTEQGPARGFVIGVTAPGSGVGKSTIATALAATLSEDLDVEVALVDADFGTHALEREFGLSGRSGLTDVLRGDVNVTEACYPVEGSGLRVVPAGTDAADAGRIARSAHAADFMNAVRDSNRFVVVDLPPVLTSTTASSLARLCDGVLIVARTGHTTKVELERTAHKLQGVRIYGVVLNRWRTRIPHWVESALALAR